MSKLFTALLFAVLLIPSSAQARPLDLHEIYEMEQYLDCANNTCGFVCKFVWEEPENAQYLNYVACDTCLEEQGCGDTPRVWEKDGVEPITQEDHDRAILEQQFPDQICYGDADENIVLPRELCGGALCESLIQQCIDADFGDVCVGTPDDTGPDVDCDGKGHCWYATHPSDQDCPEFLCDAEAEDFATFNAALLCLDTDNDGIPSWVEDILQGDEEVACEPCTDGDAACLEQQTCKDGQICAEAEFGSWRCQYRMCDYDSPCDFREICEIRPGHSVATCQTRSMCNGGTAVSFVTGADDGPVGEICDPETGTCLECVYHAHCAAGFRCAQSGNCIQADPCGNSLDCNGSQVCNVKEGFCFDCISDAECGTEGTVCSPVGLCVPACGSDLDCVNIEPQGMLCNFIEEEAGYCAECVGDQGCEYDEACVLGSCQPRKCSDGDLCLLSPTDDVAAEAVCPDLNCNANLKGDSPDCTAFHLEKVAEDDTEVVIHLYYDHTPIPARVLDLYLKYDDSQLLLRDARPLKPLQLKGKKLASSHLSDGTLVLNVYDDDGTHPIPKGPVIELVFQRVGVCPTEIGFATDRYDLLPLSVAPLQGSDELQDTLADPDLWGAPVRLCARSKIPTRLRLSYTYESTDNPIEYANVPSASDICGNVPMCEHEPDKVIKDRLLSRLDAMQRGSILANDSVSGVAGNAAYLNGASDHVAMPIHYDTPLVGSAQSFSFSTWFYTEGNDGNELSSTPQVLYSHNAYNERTSFGLMSQDSLTDDSAHLMFFLGDLLDADLSPLTLQNTSALDLTIDKESSGLCEQVNFLAEAKAYFVKQAVPLRTWHHVAMNFHAAERKFDLFFDGERVGCIEVQDFPESSQCPQLHAATDVTIHDEGDVLGGRSPEYLWLGVREGGLNKIRRMDPAGLQSEVVIGDSQYNYQDPHYSPILDRLVYSSDVSGSTEIWIARGDGSGRKQITFGFADSSRGIAARRPRFAPDGSAIVFDSNVFDVVKKDNHFARVRHIYLIQYDPDANAIAVTLPDNSTTGDLNYEDRLADGTIDDYRLTDTLDRHHKSARWLTGADDAAVGRELGALLIDTSKDDMSGHRVYLLTIPSAYPLSNTEPVPGLGTADEVRLLDAYHFVKAAFPSPILTERALLTRENLLWEKDGESFEVPDQFLLDPSENALPAQFSVECKDEGSGNWEQCKSDGSHEVRVHHNPVSYHPNCWDKNFNNVEDDEDLDSSGQLDIGDCYPPTTDLYLTYDYSQYEPVLDVVSRCSEDRDCNGGEVCGLGDSSYQMTCSASNPCPPNHTCSAAGACVAYAFVFKRCEIALQTAKFTASSQADCDAGILEGQGYLISGTACAESSPSSLSCVVPSDCPINVGSTPAHYLCDNNVCKAPSQNQGKLCLANSDCAGSSICKDSEGNFVASGYCSASDVPVSCETAACTSPSVCSPVAPKKCVDPDTKFCDPADGPAGDACTAPTESCQANECVVMGSRDGQGTTVHTKKCTQDQDCSGGNICSNSSCLRVLSHAACSTDADCLGGQVCNTEGSSSVCRHAADLPATADATTTCAVHTDCTGGQVCNLASKKCRPADGEKLMSEPGDAIFAWVGGKKDLELSGRFGDLNGSQKGLVRIEIRSPLSADPIPAGGLVTVRFKKKAISSFTALTPAIYIPRIHSETGVKDLTKPSPPVLFEPGDFFEQVTGGSFSPDGERLMLGTITNARPHLLMTEKLSDSENLDSAGAPYYGVTDSKRITAQPLAISGIEWVRQSRYYPCNWIGAYLHFQSKAFMYGFRGGVEDTRIYSGIRNDPGIRSEAERGREFLVKNGQGGELDSKLPSCGNSHLECPSYHLCIESECQMIQCDPSDPWSCADVGGRCTLRPLSVEQEQTDESGSNQGFDWVCSADCNNDNQCFTQVCLNGPCRFCDASLTCIECRDSTTQLGELTIAGTEGCPDQRSFACDSGACVTSCYAFEDGESIYLCDETTEYCDRGQCVLLDWDWGDLAPATFSGAGAMRLKVPPQPKKGWGGYTEAIDQRVPIVIQAYGNEDWNHSPEVIVEVKGGVFYGADWNRIAKFPITNRTAVEAQNNPYVLTSPYLFEDMRLRMATSPMSNPHSGATGFMEKDSPFCIAEQTEAGKNKTQAKIYCAHRPSTSRAQLGFPIQLSKRQQIDYCIDQGHSGCAFVQQSDHDYLLPGSRGVVISDVNVDGAGVMNNITQNKVCHYEGGDGALSSKDGGVDSKVVYGRLGEELSHEAQTLLASCAPSLAPSDHTAIWTGDGENGEPAAAYTATASTCFAAGGKAQSTACDPGPGQGEVCCQPAFPAVNPEASAGSGSTLSSAGVPNELHYASGQVGQAILFDKPSDSLQVPADVIQGGDAFSMEAWFRTGDLAGGLLSVSSRPKTCEEWRDRGRTQDGQYALWVNNRAVPVFCENMDTADVTPKSYLQLPTTGHDGSEVNTSVYRAGGGSYGSTVKTTYTHVAFDLQTMTLDLSDTKHTSSNGGQLGHDCKPADPSDAAESGCFQKAGFLRHLWRFEDSAKDTLTGANVNHGVTFEPGRIGMAANFGADGGYIRSAGGLPTDSMELSVEGWIKTGASSNEQTIARMGNYVSFTEPTRAAPEGLAQPLQGDCALAGGVPVPNEHCDTEFATNVVGAGEECCELDWAEKEQGAWELALDGDELRFYLVGATEDAVGGTTQAAFLRGSLDADESITDGSWRHVAVTLTLEQDTGNHNARLYVDGQLLSTSAAWDVSTLMNEGTVVLGQQTLGAGRFTGMMDDFAVWSAALTADELESIDHLGQPGSGTVGDGFGKCLLEEVKDLLLCSAADLVTTLPLGVAYACNGDAHIATSAIDLTGTPIQFAADVHQQFAAYSSDGAPAQEVAAVGWDESSPQRISISGSGSCGGTGPATWQGDPSGTIQTGVTLTVQLLDEDTVQAQVCTSGDACLFKTVDELLVVALHKDGLAVRSGTAAAQTQTTTLWTTSSVDLNDLTWHHVAIVRTASSLRIYADGEEVVFDHTVPLLKSAHIDAVESITIGQEGHCANNGSTCETRSSAYAGRIDELAFYNRALLKSEIVTLASEGNRGRPVPGRPDPTCPDTETGLVSFDSQNEGIALLNCDFVDSDPTGDTAGVVLQNVIVERKIPAESGSIIYDSGDVCLIEVTPNLTVPCYGWIGNDANLDPYNDLIDFGSYVPFQTLEVSLPRSFGHDEGFQSLENAKHQLKATIAFNTDPGVNGSDLAVTLDWDPRTVATTPLKGGTWPLGLVKQDRNYNVRIVTSPDNYLCQIFTGPSGDACTCLQAVMASGDVIVDVTCIPVREIQVKTRFEDANGVSISGALSLVDDLLIDLKVFDVFPTDAGAQLLDTQRLTLNEASLPSLKTNSIYSADQLEPVDGNGVQLSILSSPSGFACKGFAGSTTINGAIDGPTPQLLDVKCVADPTHGLQLSVAGLPEASGVVSCTNGTGMSVKFTGADSKGDQGSQTVCVDASGVISVPQLALLSGGVWNGEILSQPTPAAPDRLRCSIVGPSTDVISPSGGGNQLSVTCESPSVSVSGLATGLTMPVTVALKVGPQGSAVILETQTITPESATQIPVPIEYDFDKLLFEDEPLEVVASFIPDELECTMPPKWDAVVPLPPEMSFLVSCQVKPEPIYNLHGVVKGLVGAGLKLQLDLGSYNQIIDANGGADVPFTINKEFLEHHEYTMGIGDHPDGQFCTVINGEEGTFAQADIANVVVFCQNLTQLDVDIQLPAGFGSAKARASIIKLSGDSYEAASIEHGDFTSSPGGGLGFSVLPIAPTDAVQDQDPGATKPTPPPLTSGQYLLTVWLSLKDSQATGEPIFKHGEALAASRTFFINAPLPGLHTVSLLANEFKTTVGGPVTLYPKTSLAALDKGQEIICAWSPSNGTAPIPPFSAQKGDTKLTALLPPVLGYSVFKCEDSNGCKLVTIQDVLDFIASLDDDEEPDQSAPVWIGAAGHKSADYPLSKQDALPAGTTLDVTCWADSKDSDLGGVVDDGGTGVLSLGDSYGQIKAMPAGSVIDVPLSKFID